MELKSEYDPHNGESEPTFGFDGRIYPVKSFGEISITDSPNASWEVGPRGFRYDREWMVTAPDGTFLTQREIPPFALIHPQMTSEHLTLRAPGFEDFQLPLHVDGPRMNTSIWRDQGVQGIDQGPVVAEWIQTFVGEFVDRNPGCLPKSFTLPSAFNLVRIAPDYIRQVDQTWALREVDQTGFADGFPFLLIGGGTLIELNRRIAEEGGAPVDMRHFRPNLIATHNQPHIEDGWKRIRIGDVEFDVVKPCARCKIVTVDPDKGLAVRQDVLRILGEYRKARQLGVENVGGVLFGQNLVHCNTGTIRPSDQIEVLEYI
ncbi:MAG: MOSC domain-containing protein [bacterium]|nr:MOSC domain-containing protein [bacterium]